MRKSAGRILKLLLVKKLNLLILLFLVILLISLLTILKLSHKLILPDFKKLALGLNNQCLEDKSSRCFSNFFASFAKGHPLDESMSLLKELQKINSKTAYCHSVAHAISVAEVEKNPQKWLEGFQRVPDAECSYGYFHGIIEGKYRFSPDFKVDSKLVERVCLEIGSQGSRRSCAHAFGHVLLVQENADSEQALSVCEKLTSVIKSPCFQGVFMENVQRDNLSLHTITERESWDKSYLIKERSFCNGFSVDKRAECWRSLGPAVLAAFRRDLDMAVLFCQSAPDYPSRRSCSREMLGQDTINQLVSGENLNLTADKCSFLEGNSEEYKECVKDLVGYVLLTSKSYKNQMTLLCQNVKPEIRQECLEVVRDYSN